MRRFILSAAALALIGGILAGSAEARGYHGEYGPRGYGRPGFHVGYHSGLRTFPYGYRNWGRVWYNPSYRCNWYFNAEYNDWFYYYAPQRVYLPVSQIATYPPSVAIVNNINAPPANVPMPAPPTGISPIPGPGYSPSGMPFASNPGWPRP